LVGGRVPVVGGEVNEKFALIESQGSEKRLRLHTECTEGRAQSPQRKGVTRGRGRA
jgi:hypothetical protein